MADHRITELLGGKKRLGFASQFSACYRDWPSLKLPSLTASPMAKKKKPASTKLNGHPVEPKKAVLKMKKLPVVRTGTEEAGPVYSNNFAVQHETSVFTLLFYYVNQPVIIEGEEPKWADIREVNAKCAARLVVPADLMPEIIRALQENFQKFQMKATGDYQVIDVTEEPEK